MTGDRPRIAIADDQPDSLLILEEFLGDAYQVQTFVDGQSVLGYFDAGGEADLVLLDVVMPGLDGFEVCRRLKAAPATRHTPVIFLTFLDSAADEAFGLSLGADDFIHKPFSPAVVAARVCHHLRLGQLGRELRERNQDLERLNGSMAGVGLWDYDPGPGRLSWSAEMARLHGLADPAPVATLESWWSLLPPVDAARLARDFGTAMATGDDLLEAEYPIPTPAHGLRVLKINGVIRRDGSGRTVRLLGNARDVTADREILERVREAKEQAEAANTAKDIFLTTMSHELRTPLNAISGFAALLRTSETVPERQEQLDTIISSSDTLLQLIQDILDFSTIEAGRMRPEQRSFDVRHDLAAVTRLFLGETGRKGLALNLTVAADIPRRLEGDSALLRQILMNLISNAVKFTAAGRIDIRVQPGDSRGARTELLFQVRDTGIGIAPENRERIFEIFEQEDRSFTRRFDGAGLGLAISKGLVSLLGGAIWLESTPGVGSSFFFTAQFGTGGSGADLAETLAGLARSASAASPAILVVEDDPFSLRLMVTMLGRYGFQTASATDGASALRLLRELTVDLVLIDTRLPGRSGLDITRMIRAGSFAGCDSAIPVIALAERVLKDDHERLLSGGFTDSIGKPIDVANLLEVIRRTLGDPAPRGLPDAR
ncbi:MAG: response regulator [Rhodospirillaceae bacterium]